MPDLSREDLLRLVDAIPHIVWMTDASGKPTYLNAKWRERTGGTLEDVMRDPTPFFHPDDLATYREKALEGRKAMQPIELTLRYRFADGSYRRHAVRIVPLTPGSPGPWVATATDIEDEWRYEQQQEFLIEAGKRLGASLDTKKTLGDVAELLVPRIADWFAVDLLGENGIAERVAMAHVDPSKVEKAWAFWRRMPPKPDDPSGIYAVMRTGQPERFEEIPDEMLAQAITDPETLALIRALGLHSSMCVPLVAGNRTVGALTVVSAESKRRYVERDLAFAKALAGRIGAALENARLYAEAQQARTSAEAIATEIIAQSKETQELVVTLRRERDEAVAKAEKNS